LFCHDIAQIGSLGVKKQSILTVTNSFIDIFHEKKVSAITSHLSSAQESTTSHGLGQTQKRGGVKPVKFFF
jgi:hypothetical protein